MKVNGTAVEIGGAFAAAIAQMEQVERDLTTQLSAVREALTALRSAGGVRQPVVAVVKAERREKPKPNGTHPRGTVSEQALRSLLKAGPKSPQEIGNHFRVSRYEPRKTLDPLIASGALVTAGSTIDRTVGLPGSHAAAKEAP